MALHFILTNNCCSFRKNFLKKISIYSKGGDIYERLRISMSNDSQLLKIQDLYACIDETSILKGINLEIKPGEIHAIMGRNGSGKTTTANIIMGHPDYEVESGTVELNGKDLLEMETWERAREGVFLSFQYPQAVPGLQVGNFLRKSVAATLGEDAAKGKDFRNKLKESMKELDIPSSFLGRYVNDGFSGGEKKRFEILQLMLMTPKLAILDETDSGLDIDGIRTVAKGINAAIRGTDSGALIITHYSRILEHVKPDKIHVLIGGKIVKTGGPELALELEEKGYDWLEDSNEN
jgi:Fe-S cluster assembly ATP-binding protein